MSKISRLESFLLRHPRFAKTLSAIRRCLPPLNFITIHYAYFIIVCLVSSAIFWGSSHPAHSISYVDSLFLVVSAMTEAGLNTVNLSTMTTWQQSILFLLIMLGSTIWVSIWTVLARKQVFQRRFDEIVRAQRERAKTTGWRGSVISLKALSFRHAQSVPNPRSTLLTSNNQPTRDIRSAPHDATSTDDNGSNIRRVLSLPPPQTYGDLDKHDQAETVSADNADNAHIAFADVPHPQKRDSRNAGIEQGSTSGDYHQNTHLLLKRRAAGRNGQFHDLTREERAQLGGCEYRALRVLAVLVPLYFFLWQILGCISLAAWMRYHMPATARENGINPWWLGLFNGVSAFNNSGMSLLDANMVPFQSAYFVLITMGLMVLAGNTAYPIFLRFILWSGFKLLKCTKLGDYLPDLRATLEFILKYPRRVYTNLFPSSPTWWLLFMLICLNCVDWVAFELFNLGNPVIDKIPIGPRVLVGLFQAVAVRSGGFYVVPISEIAIAVQFLYVIMMYISVYPVVIAMRHSNVYEERSLGIYHDDERSSDGDDTPPIFDEEDAYSTSANNVSHTLSARRPNTVRRLSQTIPAGNIGRALKRTFTTWHGVGVPPNDRHDHHRNSRHAQSSHYRIDFVRQQVHGQLAHDIWWLVLAVLIITAIETSHFKADPITFSVFNIIFEVVSAYGTVGISVGVPTAAYSFAGAWKPGSKLVLCLVMLRGRHRGLPVALDHAVRLPGEHLHRDEEEDNRIRRSMSRRRESIGG